MEYESRLTTRALGFHMLIWIVAFRALVFQTEVLAMRAGGTELTTGETSCITPSFRLDLTCTRYMELEGVIFTRLGKDTFPCEDLMTSGNETQRLTAGSVAVEDLEQRAGNLWLNLYSH